MQDILLITGNTGKAAELSRLLGFEVHNQKLNVPELQESDVRDVARAKAQAAYDQLKRPVIVDDTGLYITAWNGLPGAFVAWFMESVGPEGLLKMMEGWDDRSATGVTALGYCDEDGVKVFDGEMQGRIAEQMSPAGGWGYTPIFIPDAIGKPFSEVDPIEKDKVSSRGVAARKLAAYLASQK